MPNCDKFRFSWLYHDDAVAGRVGADSRAAGAAFASGRLQWYHCNRTAVTIRESRKDRFPLQAHDVVGGSFPAVGPTYQSDLAKTRARQNVKIREAGMQPQLHPPSGSGAASARRGFPNRVCDCHAMTFRVSRSHADWIPRLTYARRSGLHERHISSDVRFRTTTADFSHGG